MRLVFAVLLGVATLSAAGETRVLFVGNSLTYTNDLPGMVERLGRLDGRRIETHMLALPNYSLGDHLDAGNVQKLARGRWDLVVLQQGPSSLEESRRDLIRDSRRIAALFPNARVAMLTVWPSRQYAASWDRVIESYTLAAQAVNGIVIPAGVAVRSAAQLRVLGEDGFHPSVAGTYLAALVTYRTIAGRLPSLLDRPETARRIAGASIGLSDEELRLLVAIAE
ncbi:MAG TPA: SGNH/GDSL hydrolase family protein [Thermoanaerobaculia bacterium]|nr:SGNH/GDSL hydrolase family protein [Thermoanaerobaculia bacterium]